MTEDDTFNALRRLTFEEMRRLRHRFWWNKTNTINPINIDDEKNFTFEVHGWTRTEYFDELDKRLNPEIDE